MQIMLRDLLNISEPNRYKLHLACRNEEGISPLDEYVSGRQNWIGWNEWRGTKNDWNREYVFSLMDFYPKRDSWLFGGIFRVFDRPPDHYKLEELQPFRKFEGRLLVSFHRYQGMRGRAYLLESYLDNLVVTEILPEPYSGETFCGFDNIDHDFSTLEAIVKNERKDWKSALSSLKGVYLISDKSNGKKYVGSAYGETGIWSRWICYIETGHGWNEGLADLIAKHGGVYARKHFKFALLEVMSMTTPDEQWPCP